MLSKKDNGFPMVILLIALLLSWAIPAGPGEQLVRYGDFEHWTHRQVRESRLLGGKTLQLYEVGPDGTWPANTAYRNSGGSPWATSNVYAKVMGVVKGNDGVSPDSHDGGLCAKLTTHLLHCKALGMVNIDVLAAGSLFLGELIEPVTSSKNPMTKMDAGIPFTQKPKSIKFDYRIQLSGSGSRIRETGFSSGEEISGKDECEALVLLQKRWEDGHGGIHAKRVGTMWQRFGSNTAGWVNGAAFPIHYGDITQTRYYKSFMQLENTKSPRVYYARNCKGKLVPVIEEGWADASEKPTHVIVFFNSSHGGAYVGSPGNTMWVDNVKMVY